MADEVANGVASASLLDLVLCPDDGGQLGVADDGRLVRCSTCDRTFSFEGGILDLMDAGSLDTESETERSIREDHAERDGLELDWQHSPFQMTEITPTVEALGDMSGQLLLELGCGNGRYTMLLLGRCKAVVAVDFSRRALERLGQRAGSRPDLLLVHADITRLRVADSAFGAALSTLVSNLPTSEHRQAMYRLAADALRTDGRFVFGTHLHGVRQRYLRTPKSGRYPDSGIYRYNFTLSECRSDPRGFFGRVEARPIQIYLPLLRRLPWPSPDRLSRVLEHIPFLRLFGALTVCTATLPKRSR